MDSGKEGDLESSAEGKKKKNSSFECVCLEVLPMCKVVLSFIARMASLQRSRAGQILSPWGLAGFWQAGLCLVLLGWQLWSVPRTAGTCQYSVLRACCIPLLAAQLCRNFGLGLLAPSSPGSCHPPGDGGTHLRSPGLPSIPRKSSLGHWRCISSLICPCSLCPCGTELLQVLCCTQDGSPMLLCTL